MNHPVKRSNPKQHKVQDWRDLGRSLGLPDMDSAEPHLDHPAYRSPKVDALLDQQRASGKPLVVIHPGARIAAHLAHLPPGGGRVVDDFAERMKHAAMLQNCAYLFARTKHGRGLIRHWPGNAIRHVQRFGLRSIGDTCAAFIRGAVQGKPSGAAGGDGFRRRLERWR